MREPEADLRPFQGGNMKKRLRFAALAVAMVLTAFASMVGGASRANACDAVDAYVTTLYSDATYQTVVGHIYPTACRWTPHGFYVQYTLEGTYSYYAIDEYAYTCGGEYCAP
jgi:hypothetical protein